MNVFEEWRRIFNARRACAGGPADFIMRSGDVMTMPEAAIRNTKVTMTVVGGKIVWRE